MKIGYARVSTEEQSLDLQIRALRDAGCERIFRDSGLSGVASVRPGLHRAMKALRPGDVLVVWRLDRLGRSIVHLLESVQLLRDREIGFCSLQEQIDTTSAAGRFYLHMLAALAEFERELIRDRDQRGQIKLKALGGINIDRFPLP